MSKTVKTRTVRPPKASTPNFTASSDNKEPVVNHDEDEHAAEDEDSYRRVDVHDGIPEYSRVLQSLNAVGKPVTLSNNSDLNTLFSTLHSEHRPWSVSECPFQ